MTQTAMHRIAAAAAAFAVAAIAILGTTARSTAAPHHSAPAAAQVPFVPSVTRPAIGIYDPGIPRYPAWEDHVTGRLHQDIDLYYQQMLTPLPKAALNANEAAGQMTLIDLDPYLNWKIPGVADHRSPPVEVDLTARLILHHRLDVYLTQYAQDIAALHYPVALSFAHEANGDWYPWGYATVHPRMLARAWRYIWRLFRREGATNVIWVWIINKINPWDHHLAGAMRRATWHGYPGASYVDWIGVDAYLRQPGQRFSIVLPTLRFLRRLAPGKPVLLTETGVKPNPHERAQLRSLVAGIRRHHMIAMLYFNHDALNGPWALTPNELRYLGRLLPAYDYGSAG